MYSNWNAESRKLSGNSPGFMINDDRFILGSLENWEFGVDNTGDLMEPANLERLVERSRQLGDIHLVRNALPGQVSISIHVYGANIGAVQRWVYAPDGTRKPFISGYSNTMLPNLWDRSKEGA